MLFSLMIGRDSLGFMHWRRNLIFLSIFIAFQKLVRNQFSKKLKVFQCDGGEEFNSSEFTNYLARNGIQRQISCSHTPEQNGVTDIKHMTGGEAFTTPIFLINRITYVDLWWWWTSMRNYEQRNVKDHLGYLVNLMEIDPRRDMIEALNPF